MPYGFNDHYVHLPEEALFCVKDGKETILYKTDTYGGRIFNNKKFNKKIQVLGDSQVLGLDIENIDDHYLSKLHSKNFVIYAAPNNGPYEVINFLNINKKILKEKIIINFNFSVDIYRINKSWSPEKFVALKDYQLDEILEYPIKYRLIIFKNLLFRKNFTLKRYDNEKMQKVFLETNHEMLMADIKKYFNELNKIAEDLNIDIDFIITKPYWIYSKDKNNTLILKKKIDFKVDKIICESFTETSKIRNIYISDTSNKKLTNNDLTSDNRHFKSTIIKLVKKNQFCY